MFPLMTEVISQERGKCRSCRCRDENTEERKRWMKTLIQTFSHRWLKIKKICTWTHHWWWLSLAVWWQLPQQHPPAGGWGCFWPPSCRSLSTGSNQPGPLAWWHSGSPCVQTNTVTESHVQCDISSNRQTWSHSHSHCEHGSLQTWTFLPATNLTEIKSV